jgi:hypothetical protein
MGAITLVGGDVDNKGGRCNGQSFGAIQPEAGYYWTHHLCTGSLTVLWYSCRLSNFVAMTVLWYCPGLIATDPAPGKSMLCQWPWQAGARDRALTRCASGPAEAHDRLRPRSRETKRTSIERPVGFS